MLKRRLRTPIFSSARICKLGYIEFGGSELKTVDLCNGKIIVHFYVYIKNEVYSCVNIKGVFSLIIKAHINILGMEYFYNYWTLDTVSMYDNIRVGKYLFFIRLRGVKALYE